MARRSRKYPTLESQVTKTASILRNLTIKASDASAATTEFEGPNGQFSVKRAKLVAKTQPANSAFNGVSANMGSNAGSLVSFERGGMRGLMQKTTQIRLTASTGPAILERRCSVHESAVCSAAFSRVRCYEPISRTINPRTASIPGDLRRW
jgi:hypothetical protein